MCEWWGRAAPRGAALLFSFPSMIPIARPAPLNLPVPSDMRATPPAPCAFEPRQPVIFTNGSGVRMLKTVRGFSAAISEVRPRAFVYLDLDCWWFTVEADRLERIPDTPAPVS